MVTFNGNSLLIGDLFSPICVKHFFTVLDGCRFQICFFVDSFISLLSYRRPKKKKQKHTRKHNNKKVRLIEKKSFSSSSAHALFTFKNTKIPFVSFAGRLCCVGASRLFHKAEWNKKKTLNTTRGLYDVERYKNRLFVYLLWICLCFKLSLYISLYFSFQKLLILMHFFTFFYTISINDVRYFHLFDNDTKNMFTFSFRDSNKRLSSLSFCYAFHTCWWFLFKTFTLRCTFNDATINFFFHVSWQRDFRLRWHNKFTRYIMQTHYKYRNANENTRLSATIYESQLLKEIFCRCFFDVLAMFSVVLGNFKNKTVIRKIHCWKLFPMLN